MTQKPIKDSCPGVPVGVPVTADTVALVATIAQNVAAQSARIPEPQPSPDIYLVFPEDGNRKNSYSQH